MEAYDLKWNGTKINSFNYLRVLAMFMILYDHLGCLRNQEWMIKKAVDFFFSNPLFIIQDFGAFGVSLFFLISGFLFAWKGQYEHLTKKTCRRLLKIYLSLIAAFLGFWLCQAICWNFQETYWQQFTIRQWLESITLVGYLTGNGEVINGSTWFLVPLFFFYIVSAFYAAFSRRLFCKGGGMWIIEGFLAALFYTLDRMHIYAPTNMMIFVYMPLAGVILAEIYHEKNIAFGNGLVLLLVNYMAMVFYFKKFQYEFYAENLYLISFLYAVLFVVICLTWEKRFTANKYVDFFGSISLSVYLLHMTWGGFLMQAFTEMGIPFTAAFIFTVFLIFGIACFHTKYIENGILKRLLSGN